MTYRRFVLAFAAAFSFAAFLACQPPLPGAGEKIPITENVYFVIPSHWQCTNIRFGYTGGRGYDLRILRDDAVVGKAKVIWATAKSAPASGYAVEGAPAHARSHTPVRESSFTTGSMSFRMVTACYILHPHQDPYHKEPIVTPPWVFVGSATTYAGDVVITVWVSYDIPTDAVPREATTVPPSIIASYEKELVTAAATCIRRR